MRSKKLLSVSALVASIPFSVSMIMFLCNVRYLKYASVFGDYIKEMRYNYAILGYTFDNATEEMYEGFVNKGNLSFTAICIAVAIIIALLVVLFVSLKMKSIEAVQEQTDWLRNNINTDENSKSHFCHKCGTAVQTNSSFCSNCGTPLDNTQANKISKEKNKFSTPLIVFMIIQFVGLFIGLFAGNVGGVAMMCSIIAIPFCLLFGILAIAKANKINGKSGLAIGIVAVALYGLIALIILLSAIISNL